MWDIPKYWLYIFFGGLALGLLVLGRITTLGPAFNQADYNNFNSSSQHINAVAQRFADDSQQEAETTDPVASTAIEQDIYSLAATAQPPSMRLPDGGVAAV